jgi:hypothetical protein
MLEDGRLNSQLDAATAAVFGVLRTAKERNDPALTLQAADRVITLVELRARLISTFLRTSEEEQVVVVEEMGQARDAETTVKAGGGGHD